MTGFKPRTSGVGSDRSTNCATTTFLGLNITAKCSSTIWLIQRWTTMKQISAKKLLWHRSCLKNITNIQLKRFYWNVKNNCIWGCRSSSVDSSAPSILPPLVWVPSTPSTLFSIYIVQIVYLSFELECEKNKNKQKEAGIGPYLKNI